MTNETLRECANCGWQGPDDATNEIRDISMRVEPGEPMPAGECPECGALASYVDRDDIAADLLRALEGLIDVMPAPGTRKLTVAWDIARAAKAKAKAKGLGA